MPLVSDRSICLRKTEFSETSQVVTLFSQAYGIVRLIAKGAHRKTKAGASKFGGGVDYLEVGDAVFSHDPARDLPPLTEWHLTDGHLALRKSLRAMVLGLYGAELISRLIEEHDAHADLFARFEMTLSELAAPRREEQFLAFELDLLRMSGYLPELAVCVSCGKPVDGRPTVFFSADLGGVLCRDCISVPSPRVEIDGRLLRVMQMILQLPRSQGGVSRLPQLTRHQTDPINRLLADHIQQTLGKRLRLPNWVLGRNASQ